MLKFTTHSAEYFIRNAYAVLPVQQLISLSKKCKNIELYSARGQNALPEIAELYRLDRYGNIRYPMRQDDILKLQKELQDAIYLVSNTLSDISNTITGKKGNILSEFRSQIDTFIEQTKILLPKLHGTISTYQLEQNNSLHISLLKNIEDALIYMLHNALDSSTCKNEELIDLIIHHASNSNNYYILLRTHWTAYVLESNASDLTALDTLCNPTTGPTPIKEVFKLCKGNISNTLFRAINELHLCLYDTQITIYKQYNNSLYKQAIAKLAALEQYTGTKHEVKSYDSICHQSETNEIIHEKYDLYKTMSPSAIKSMDFRPYSSISEETAEYLRTWALCIHYSTNNNPDDIIKTINAAMRLLDPTQNSNAMIEFTTMGIKHLLDISPPKALTFLNSQTHLTPTSSPILFEFYYYKYLTFAKNNDDKKASECLKKLNEIYDNATQKIAEISHDSDAYKTIQHLNEIHFLKLISSTKSKGAPSISKPDKELADKYLARLDGDKNEEYGKLLAECTIDASTEANEWLLSANPLPKTSTKKAQAKKPPKKSSKVSKNTLLDEEDDIEIPEVSSQATKSTELKSTPIKATKKTSSASADDDAVSMSSHSSSAASKASSDSKVMMSYKVKLPSTIQDFAMMIDSKTISFDSINSHHNLIPKLQEAYYQFKHSQFRHEQYEDVVNYSTSWKIGRQAYSSVDHKVYKIESMHHCYATIAPTLNLSDTTIAHKFYEAIAQCRIAKKEGQSGIKIFYNVVELKINDSDSRLIAKAYKNTKGGVLFVFDEIKTHQEIKKMAEMRSILNLNPCEMIDKINYQNSDYLQKDLENAQTCYAQILGEYAKNLEIEIEI